MTAAPTPTGTYALDNHHQAAAEHHRGLAELLDRHTQQRLRGLPGWSAAGRCLEVGAGGGSMSHWLADQVGPGGRVVAVDLKPDHIAPHPALAVVGHDLTGPVPLGDVVGGGFDLILSRMTLQHLPNRRQLLHQLAGLLGSGGVLVVEDWATGNASDDLIAAPSPAAAALYQRFRQAVAGVFDAAGADRTWARRIHAAMMAERLHEVSTLIRAEYWTGGEPGLRLAATTAAQLRPRLLAAGMTARQLDVLIELVHDPQLVVQGHPLYSTSGRRGGKPKREPGAG